MSEIMVDSCVLLDIFTRDPTWFDWSSKTVSDLAQSNILIINPIVYAEISVGFDRIEDLEEALPHDLVERKAIPLAAAFLAGKCFRRYRRAGGLKPSPLPDFFIGAHAAVEGMSLVTRDQGRFISYFPKLPLIVP